MKIFVETERLILREIVAADCHDFYELDADPEVHKYLGNKPVQNVEQSKEMIKLILQQYEDNGIGRWAMIEKATNELIGWTGLKYEQSGVNNYAAYYDLGYRLKKKHWGKGMATESAVASLQYGFETMHLSEIFGAAHVDNIGSNKILQKVGLKYIEAFDDGGEPHHWYGITQADWVKR